MRRSAENRHGERDEIDGEARLVGGEGSPVGPKNDLDRRPATGDRRLWSAAHERPSRNRRRRRPRLHALRSRRKKGDWAISQSPFVAGGNWSAGPYCIPPEELL